MLQNSLNNCSILKIFLIIHTSICKFTGIQDVTYDQEYATIFDNLEKEDPDDKEIFVIKRIVMIKCHLHAQMFDMFHKKVLFFHNIFIIWIFLL
jgi:hypothetical protein